MHDNVIVWVRWNLPSTVHEVLEFGSLDINGGVWQELPDGTRHTGIDVQSGPGVDIVADAIEYRHPHQVDTVLCLEVLEHCADWPGIIYSAYANLKPGGTFIGTCAGPGRAPHSGRVEGPPEPDEHYANVRATELDLVLAGAGFEKWDIHHQDFDLQWVAVKGGTLTLE